MNLRNSLLDEFKPTQHHVRSGRTHVKRQRQIIARLEAGSRNAEEARALLAAFGATQPA